MERPLTPDLRTSSPLSEFELVDSVKRELLERLPSEWSVSLQRPGATSGDMFDGLLEVGGPEGTNVFAAIDVRLAPSNVDLRRSVERMRNALRDATLPPSTAIVIASRYLSPTNRERLRELGVSYVDATGNVLFAPPGTGIFIRDRGADADPWRPRGRPRGTLKGPPAAKVVRALVDVRPPYSRPDLVNLSSSSSGVAYRVVDFLESEDLLIREGATIVDVRWRKLIERWALDYGFASSNRTVGLLAPRGTEALLERLRSSHLPPEDYAITGSFVAARYAPYAPPKLVTMYVKQLELVVSELDLRPVERGANVVLAQTKYGAVFDRARFEDRLTWVAPSQAAVDLLSGPGRQPSEGMALLDWMERNESEWRT